MDLRIYLQTSSSVKRNLASESKNILGKWFLVLISVRQHFLQTYAIFKNYNNSIMPPKGNLENCYFFVACRTNITWILSVLITGVWSNYIFYCTEIFPEEPRRWETKNIGWGCLTHTHTANSAPHIVSYQHRAEN